MHEKCGSIEDAQMVLKEDAISKCGQGQKALELFQ
jgi:hypothetical protein